MQALSTEAWSAIHALTPQDRIVMGHMRALVAVSYTHLATSWYSTDDLRRTLERLVDFDRINAKEMRFSVGAVSYTHLDVYKRQALTLNEKSDARAIHNPVVDALQVMLVPGQKFLAVKVIPREQKLRCCEVGRACDQQLLGT